MNNLFIWSPLLSTLVLASYTDFRRRLIYDKLTIPAVIYFLGFHLIFHSNSITQYFTGFFLLGLTGVVMAFISSGAIGGGDIKLLAVIGAAIGWRDGLQVFVYIYLSSGLVALVLICLQKTTCRFTNIKSLPMAPFMLIGNIIFFYVKYIAF